MWDQITKEDVTSLQTLLDSNPKESEAHSFLETNPKFLVQVLGTGHGRYQLSKPRLGAEYIPDFLLAQNSSIGMEWFAVEIKSPRVKADRRDGDPSQYLNHAIGQIRDWRNWFMENLDYARRPKEQNGLSLIGIDPRLPGLVLMGRRHEYSPRFNQYRRDMINNDRITIHSYDWLLDVAYSNSSGWLTTELPRGAT